MPYTGYFFLLRILPGHNFAASRRSGGEKRGKLDISGRNDDSGVNGRVYDREAGFRETLSDAEKVFGRILREKTNPNRRNPRKYVVESSEQIGSVLASL